MPPLGPSPLLQHRQALFPGPQCYLPFLPPTVRLWLRHLFSPICQIFRQTSSCSLLCAHVSQMVSMNIIRYFTEILQMLWKTPRLWCVLKISSPKKPSHWVLKPLPALLTDFIMYSFLPLHPFFWPLGCKVFGGRYFLLCIWTRFNIMRSYCRIGNSGATITQRMHKMVTGLSVSMAKQSRNHHALSDGI